MKGRRITSKELRAVQRYGDGVDRRYTLTPFDLERLELLAELRNVLRRYRRPALVQVLGEIERLFGRITRTPEPTSDGIAYVAALLPTQVLRRLAQQAEQGAILHVPPDWSDAPQPLKAPASPVARPPPHLEPARKSTTPPPPRRRKTQQGSGLSHDCRRRLKLAQQRCEDFRRTRADGRDEILDLVQYVGRMWAGAMDLATPGSEEEVRQAFRRLLDQTGLKLPLELADRTEQPLPRPVVSKPARPRALPRVAQAPAPGQARRVAVRPATTSPTTHTPRTALRATSEDRAPHTADRVREIWTRAARCEEVPTALADGSVLLLQLVAQLRRRGERALTDAAESLARRGGEVSGWVAELR